MKVLVRPSKSHPPMLWVAPEAAKNLVSTRPPRGPDEEYSSPGGESSHLFPIW